MPRAAPAETVSPDFPEPRANPDLVGHRDAENRILDAMAGGRIHHAWLIAGPRGIGKATLAYRFGRALLASGEGQAALAVPSADSADSLALEPDSPVFRKVAARSHPDLLAIERGLNTAGTRLRNDIVVDDVRTVSTFLSLTAAERGFRVVIIDGAEWMNRQAANALLKTLEEPPPRTVILLISHAPGRLLPTIRSRCRRLVLRPLGDPEILGLLSRYAPGLDEADRLLATRLGEGSIGRALALVEAGGTRLYGAMVDLLASAGGAEIARIHALADQLGRSGGEGGHDHDSFEVFSDLLRWWLNRLIRCRALGQLPQALTEGEDAAIARCAGAGTLDQWLEVWEKTGRLFERARSVNLDRRQVLLNVFAMLPRPPIPA